MTTDRTQRQAMIEVAAALVNEVGTRLNGNDPRLCHSAAFALRNVLDYFGVESEVVAVDVLVVRRHESLPGGGYLATCGNPPHPFDDSKSVIIPTKPIAPHLLTSDFHSVVFIDSLMVDPTAGQFARPQFGIDIPPVLYANMDEAQLAELPVFTVPQDAHMQYSRSAVEKPYEILNTGHGSLVRKIAGEVIRTMKKLAKVDEAIGDKV